MYRAAHTSGEESPTSALWRIFITFYTMAAAIGEFYARGTKLFADFVDTWTNFARVMESVFVPVICFGSSLSFTQVIAAKAVAPFLLILAVCFAPSCYFGCCHRHAVDIPLTSRLVRAFVWVTYFVYPPPTLIPFPVFPFPDPPDPRRHQFPVSSAS